MGIESGITSAMVVVGWRGREEGKLEAIKVADHDLLGITSQLSSLFTSEKTVSVMSRDMYSAKLHMCFL